MADIRQSVDHLAVLTLVFPDSRTKTFPRNAPRANQAPIPGNNTSAHYLPSTSNPLYPISQDSTLAFSVPFDEASDFLREVQELPNEVVFPNEQANEVQRTKSWVMKTPRTGGNASQSTVRSWASNAWTSFVDLIKVYFHSYTAIASADGFMVERRVLGHYYHGSRLSGDASDFRFAVFVYATHGI